MPPQAPPDYPPDWTELQVEANGELSHDNIQLLHRSHGLLIRIYPDDRYDKYSIKYFRRQHKKTMPVIPDGKGHSAEAQRLRVWRHKTEDMTALLFLRTGGAVAPAYCLSLAVEQVTNNFDIAAAVMQVCTWTAKHVHPKNPIEILSEQGPNPNVPPKNPTDGASGPVDGVFSTALNQTFQVQFMGQLNASNGSAVSNADPWPKPLNRWTVINP